ncbi:hypothetical protein RDABS01_023342 [Bienertia sinuspersici]
MDMDTILKPCTTNTSLLESCDRPLIDRLSSLLDEVLIRILSLLTTKDAAATWVLSKRPRRPHCATHPYKIQQFPCLDLCRYYSQYLTRGCSAKACGNQYLPDLTSYQIQSWISFPFTRCGLKELDLCIYTRCGLKDFCF